VGSAGTSVAGTSVAGASVGVAADWQAVNPTIKARMTSSAHNKRGWDLVLNIVTPDKKWISFWIVEFIKD
jgi:hypothetical protein